MTHIYAREETEAMIFVDAFNAFNRLKRQLTLRNTQAICLTLCRILVNTYRNESLLFVDGQCLLSKEGTTQGDPLAKAMYAASTQPLIYRLDGIARQVWYADDSAAGSTVESLKGWWDLMQEIGPIYGYYPNGAKTLLLVKHEAVETVREVFKDTGISITIYGGEHADTLEGQYRLRIIHQRVHRDEGPGMDRGNQDTQRFRKNTAPCSLRCLHTWPLSQMELPLESHQPGQM